MKTIVVGYDESEAAKRALARAAELAQTYDAKLVVTSVARTLTGALSARGLDPVDPVDDPAVHRAELDQAAAFLSERGLTAEYDITLGDPATEIVDLAEKRGADLIVVGTREPNLISRLLGLSVSESVQRRAHCDVLIVH